MNEFQDAHSVGRDGQVPSENPEKESHLTNPAPAGAADQCACEAHTATVGRKNSSQEDGCSQSTSEARSSAAATDNPSVLDLGRSDAHFREVEDRRFLDPIVAEIVQLHRLRRRWMKARNALVLQGKAIGRAFSAGDKAAGTKAYEIALAGHGDPVLEMALAPFVPAIERFEADMASIEKQLVRLAKKLPIAPFVESVRGLGWSGVSGMVGEAGDLSAYPTISGVWKRLGLAVIDGGRQRRVADVDAALVHGYSAERRSVVWVMADAMAKQQRTWLDKETGEVKKEPGPYGLILEAEKAKALAKGWTPLHSENHAKRVMSKMLLKDLTLAWRAAS
jgi:hypothetical protein